MVGDSQAGKAQHRQVVRSVPDGDRLLQTDSFELAQKPQKLRLAPSVNDFADEVAGKKATDKDHLLQQVLFDLVQSDTIKNSLTLGSHILKKIKPVHKLHSRNTEQAAFVVLKSPSVPSVLVETSFITNPEEERLLGTAAFRQKIATAIAEGVISYFHWFDNQKAHSKKR